LFAGTLGRGVWRRPLSEMNVTLGIRRQAALSQSPFHLHLWTSHRAQTNINIGFSIPHAERVNIAVCDLSGHRVATLADKRLVPGIHQIRWNTRTVAPGCYTIKIKSGIATEIKCLTVVK
jgi:hypothetical protein